MNTDSLSKEITICKRKLTILKKRGTSEQDDAYQYWLNRLVECEHARFKEVLAELEQQYGRVTLERRIISSGAIQITAYTESGRYIKHLNQDLIPVDILDNIPTTQDYRINNPPCVVCGALGTEEHHWAPKELFPETYHKWPTAYLCSNCHKEWHNRITNPFRTLRNKQEVINGR